MSKPDTVSTPALQNGGSFPEQGQLVEVRRRQWVVGDVGASAFRELFAPTFVSLLGVRRCFGPVEGTLDSLFAHSLEHQNEVTDTLGEQVRRAVEVLVQALDRADLDRDRQLLKDVSPAQLYEAGLTFMMRLVVLLCAEERKLLLLGEPIYDQNYAVSTLRSRLREDKERLGDEVLERRHDAWARLLAVFRAIFGGIEHETLRLPALGGSLFDPDRFPFLEGRATCTSWRETPAVPLPIDNRTVLMLLTALQVLEQRTGALLLSYEALDVEQIGHVYEGLLERTVKRVPEATLGLIGSQKAVNPTVPLLELETAKSAGDDKLLAYLLEKTGRSESALNNALAKKIDESLYHRVLLACGSDIPLAERIKPFSLLLRTDSWGDPLAYRENSFIVTLGAGRRETGTHYTPKSLTEPIVQYTLEPLVYVGPAEGKSQTKWRLKSPREILALKVCDMAMGSAAFLVQTCRWLGDRLVEAWDAAEKAGRSVSIEGEVLDQPGDTELLPRDQAERVLIARRLVASRCLYGVDINPMAVELAKVSLWLVTMMKGRPFNFLDHALKCGDSLLGVSSLKQIENFSLGPGEQQVTFATANLFRYVEEADQKRRELENLPSNDYAQIEAKSRLNDEAQNATAKVKALADCLIAFELRGFDGDSYEEKRAEKAEKVQLLMKRDADARIEISNPKSELARASREALRGRRPFHWPVEFPEIFACGGFDGLVGNPPFMGGTLATERLGADYMSLLQSLMPPWHGKADYVVGFFKRIPQIVHGAGKVSLVATSSLLRGETLDSGLRDLMQQKWQVYSARSPYKWPGTATLEVVNASLSREWKGEFILDGEIVDGITEEFAAGEPDGLAPKELSVGHLEGALGIKLCPANRELQFRQYEKSLAEAPELQEFFVPALGGDEIYDLIDFNHAPRSVQPEKLSTFLRNGGSLSQRGGVAILSPADYAHSAPASGLMAVLKRSRFAFACGETSTALRFCRVPNTDSILKHKLIVFPGNSWTLFALLQSDIHAVWAWRWGLRRESRVVYSPKRCSLTFPLPSGMANQFADGLPNLAPLGENYHDFRNQLMMTRQEGLTKTYNRFHNPDEQSEDIKRLRALHVEIDQAVAAAYGWSDLDLGHGSHETKQGVRYTISESARRTVLDRLLVLNHQRYAEEVKAGLHDKVTKKIASKKKKSGAATPQGELIKPPQEELSL